MTDSCEPSDDYQYVTPLAAIRGHPRNTRSPGRRRLDVRYSRSTSPPHLSILVREGKLYISREFDEVCNILISSIIGVSFDVCYEKAREKPVGKLSIVTATSQIPMHHRITWIWLTILTITLSFSVWIYLGLWSCIAISGGMIFDLARSSSGDGHWLGRRVLAVTFLLVAWLLGIFIQALLAYFSTFSNNELTAAYTWATLSLASLFAVQPFIRSKLKDSLKSLTETIPWNASKRVHILMSFMEWRPPPLPMPVHPIVLEFSQEELSYMFKVRSLLWKNDDTRGLIRDVWIGGATVEATLSLLPAPLYANRHLRWGLHLLLDYFLPAYTILQGLGNLLPFVGYHAASLLAMLRGDAGVRIFLSILKFQRQLAEASAKWLYSTLGSALSWLLAHMHAGTTALLVKWARALIGPGREAIETISAMIRACGQALLTAIRVANSAAQKYLVPSDYMFVYLRAKLAPVRILLESWSRLWKNMVIFYRNAASSLWKGSVTLLTPFWKISIALYKLCILLCQMVFHILSPLKNFGLALYNLCMIFTQAFYQALCSAGGCGKHLCFMIKWFIFRPPSPPNMAQVGKKVADEGNRLARHVNMQRDRIFEVMHGRTQPDDENAENEPFDMTCSDTVYSNQEPPFLFRPNKPRSRSATSSFPSCTYDFDTLSVLNPEDYTPINNTKYLGISSSKDPLTLEKEGGFSAGRHALMLNFDTAKIELFQEYKSVSSHKKESSVRKRRNSIGSISSQNSNLSEKLYKKSELTPKNKIASDK